MSRRFLLSAVLALCFGVCGCVKPVHFPLECVSGAAAGVKASAAYDTDGDGRSDYFTFADGTGRIVRIGYARTSGQKPDEIVKLDAIAFRKCRHLVVILDGIGYDLVRQYYDAGGLRMFHAPSRVVAPYPTLTDPSLEDALDYIPPRAFEARYFDRRANRLAGGSGAYLRGENQPYNRLLNYRADMIWDVIGYVLPGAVFGKELNDAMRRFDKARTQEFLAYFVSSAGMGTQRGAAGHRQCLRLVERFVNQVIWQTRGLTKVTMFADHGHSYTPSRRIPLESYLKGRGWRLTESLRRPKDVVYVRFGLETYASFATGEAAELAADLVACEGVTLASYAEGETVIVLSPAGRAVITRKGNAYKYEPTVGDPLKLRDILGAAEADPAGFRDAEKLLEATASHLYPAPLQRLWRAHFALVENPPDVIISLADKFYAGSKSFGARVKVASTHGGLNSRNSMTFIMSTIGPLPPLMRSGDIPKNMRKLTGAPWPARR